MLQGDNPLNIWPVKALNMENINVKAHIYELEGP